MSVKYNFVNNDIEQNFNEIAFFYHIAFFKNKDKHHLRKYVIDPEDTIVGYYNYYLSEPQIRKFMKTKKCNEYKCFNVQSLDNISMPSASDITILRSELC